MSYNFEIRHETHSTFLHPDGLPEDDNPYITEWGLVLPGIVSARFELDAFKDYVANATKEEIKQRPVPTLKQLGRIALNEITGCWELPIYKDGHDVYNENCNSKKARAGKPRARYGSMMVKGANNKPTDHLAHKTMYAILRGPVPSGMHIDHLCRNSKCCYHRHLEVVTVKENTSRIHQAKELSSGQLQFENS